MIYKLIYNECSSLFLCIFSLVFLEFFYKINLNFRLERAQHAYESKQCIFDNICVLMSDLN